MTDDNTLIPSNSVQINKIWLIENVTYKLFLYIYIFNIKRWVERTINFENFTKSLTLFSNKFYWHHRVYTELTCDLFTLGKQYSSCGVRFHF